MLVPGTYYSRVATEAHRVHEDNLLWKAPVYLTESIETAFGFTHAPSQVADLDPTDAEFGIVRTILSHRNVR